MGVFCVKSIRKKWLVLLSFLILSGIGLPSIPTSPAAGLETETTCLNQTPDLQISGKKPFDFIAFGDNGDGSAHEKKLAAQMEAQFCKTPYKLALMLGDNLYIMPYDVGRKYDDKLFNDRFTQIYKDLIFQGVQFKAALGNHDVRADEGGDTSEAMNLFHMPDRYYTYRVGPDVQFFVLDTMALDDAAHPQNPNYPDDKQVQWLEKQLKESSATWKIVYGHYPLYSSGKHGEHHGNHTHLQALLQPLFEKYHVALYLSGHEHVYERFEPIHQVEYIVSGGGGAPLGSLDPTPTAHSIVRDRTHFHFIHFTLTNAALRFQTIDEDGALLDKGSIPKP